MPTASTLSPVISKLAATRATVAACVLTQCDRGHSAASVFVWGAFVFGIDLFDPSNLAGFTLMTVVTASAAAAFGMLLAAACRTRAQLSGISTIVILIMSAVGGSMFPRFLMPEGLKQLGLLTFNGWALDGYLKVFWYQDPDAGLVGSLLRLWPQVLVLALATVAFLSLARVLARRWETT